MRRPGPDSQAPPNSSFPNQGSSGKTFSQKGTFLQHASRFDPTGEDTFCSRRVSFIRDTAKSEVGRQIKAVFKELEETDWGQKNFGNCAELQNPISLGSNPGEGSSQSKNEYRSIHFQKVPHVSGEVLSNLFLVDKSDGGKRPVINLKNLNSFIPYLWGRGGL